MVRLSLVMPKLLAPFLGSLRRRSTSVAPSSAAAAQHHSQRQLARNFADAIDQAMALRQWEQAQRLADASGRLAPDNARLSEQLARLKLVQGDPETALAIVESCNTMPASLRLLRAVCQWLLGAKADAHLDLLQWSKKASAPLDARLLLALIDWKAGDLPASIKTLRQNLRHLDDPRTLETLFLISLHRGNKEQAENWAQQLRQCLLAAASVPIADVMLRSLGQTGMPPQTQVTDKLVATLAMELISFEAAILPLVEAQHKKNNPHTVRLLCSAIERALVEFSDRAAAIHSLARLYALQGDLRSARRWALSGQAEFPLYVPLALMARKFTQDEAESFIKLGLDTSLEKAA